MSTDDVAASLVRMGVRLLPVEDRPRWREEWLAEMDAAPSKLVFSLSVCTAAAAMASGCRSRRVLAEAATAASRGDVRRVVAGRPPYNAGVEFWS